jgi:hypothetical protein
MLLWLNPLHGLCDLQYDHLHQMYQHLYSPYHGTYFALLAATFRHLCVIALLASTFGHLLPAL